MMVKLIWNRDGTKSLEVTDKQKMMLGVMKITHDPKTIVRVAGKRLRLEQIEVDDPKIT